MTTKRSKNKSFNPPERLTDKQFELLAYLYRSGLSKLEPGHVQVRWSPKAFLGRSPTRSESAGLSQRVASLVSQGLLRRVGPHEVLITESAKDLMRKYVVKRLGNPETAKGPNDEALFYFLDIERKMFLFETLRTVEAEFLYKHKAMNLSYEDAQKAFDPIRLFAQVLRDDIAEWAEAYQKVKGELNESYVGTAA